jgi:Ca-activated chloride channel homolog
MTRAPLRLALPFAALLAAAVAASVQPPAKLSSKEKAEHIKALPEDDRIWLTDYVAPIILPEEENLFVQLSEQAQRDKFKTEFWKRREKQGLQPPLGPGYQQRYQHLREIAAAQYDGFDNDAGRMIVRRGEPESVEDLTFCDAYRQVEVWSYPESNTTGNTVHHIFYRPSWGSPRKLWLPGDNGIFQTSSCVSSFAAACTASTPHRGDLPCKDERPNPPPGAVPKECAVACHVLDLANEVITRSGTRESAYMNQGPSLSTEGLDLIWASLAAPDANAKPLGQVVPASNKQEPPPAPAQAAPPARPAKAPSKSELIKALPEDDKQWLTVYVAPIILPEEEKVFLELTEPHERERFKEEFWARRERDGLPAPMGPGYRSRYEELRRLADEVYDGWQHDAGRMVVRWGEPADLHKVECDNIFRGVEIWTYPGTGTMSGTKRYLFYRPGGVGNRRMWDVSIPESDVFAPASCVTFAGLIAACRNAVGCGTSCADSCDVYRVYTEIKARQGQGLGGVSDSARLLAPPPVPTEGVEQVKNMSPTAVNPKAKGLSVAGPADAAPADASAGGKPTTAAPVKKKLTSKEIKEAIAKLPQKYRDFLQLTELIIAEEEKQVFLQITEDYQRDAFIEAFWKRRSLDAQGLRVDYRAVHTQRVETALEQFGNLHNDRAKIFVISGPPDTVIPIDCPEVFVPIQIWYWERLESLKSKTYLLFYKKWGTGEYTLWLPFDGITALYPGGGGPGAQRVDPSRCTEYRTVLQAMNYEQVALGSGPMAMMGASKLIEPPQVETEGIDHILNMTTGAAANAAPIGVTKLIRFPEMRVNKMAVDLSVVLPKSELKARELGEDKFYNVDVIGEVVKDERLIDNFKYRFDIPFDEIKSDQIPVTVRRYLYPGVYKLVMKIADSNQNAEAHLTEKLTVPEQPDAPPPVVAAARDESRTALKKTADQPSLLPSAIAILPIAKELATGLQRIETRVAEGIRAVDFYLNGSKVMTKTRPPFEADVNLGPLPRKQTVRVVAYGPDGRAVGEDEYVVNEGKEVFRVRILSPEKGARVSGPVKVVAAVAVPEDKSLQKLEFYNNETRVATLYQQPFEQTIRIKDTKSLGYVRVVGTLDDGSIAEDLRYVNAPEYISEVTVDAVELYTTVTEKGRPVSGLTATNFKVFEDGVIQKIESFDYVKNLPLTVGVAVDTSASMLESLPEVQKAATAFLDSTLGPKDRAFTLSFDNEPYILAKMTNRKERLIRSLGGMRAEGSTALYDAIVYALYQFAGVKGKKALVLLTDGKDTASKFEYDTMLEYVKKSGISIYAIGFRISGAELEVKSKLNKVASVTGGQTFYVNDASHLDAVYKQINEELRSQYFLTYYSTAGAANKDQWRKVEIKVEPSNLVARAISGYYP